MNGSDKLYGARRFDWGWIPIVLLIGIASIPTLILLSLSAPAGVTDWFVVNVVRGGFFRSFSTDNLVMFGCGIGLAGLIYWVLKLWDSD